MKNTILSEDLPKHAIREPMALSSGWELQDAAQLTARPDEISQRGFQTDGWHPATVPGTVLTTLVNNGVYPEPLYGENNRPDKIPESLCRTSYWYRNAFTVPAAYAGRNIWLNFEGINYAAEVWVNGRAVGEIKGAFLRGIFDITSAVHPGDVAVLAVHVSPQPNPGEAIEHNLANGMGKNGGISAVDGPTFLCSMGWDWIPGIRDRNTGIWQKVFLSATGPVLIQEPLVTTDLPLPRLDSADIKIQVTLKNLSDQAQRGVLKGTFGDVSFQQEIELEARATKAVTLDPSTIPGLALKNPKLWWPNGYGEPHLYPVHLAFEVGGVVSDTWKHAIGIREITYSVPDSENLTLSVNGVRLVCKGGNWGMDEALKRIPRERLEAQVRMHKQANYNMIRNWVGQSTGGDLYDLCDKYGIMLWDEFFQPNPDDGPNPTDFETYLANVRDKMVRFRNHPSIVIWCGRNEGDPPERIDTGIRKLMAELEPKRLYQASSTKGRGVHSGGPYRWRTPVNYYEFSKAFKTEIGSVSIPTLESVQAMLPKKDWESINDAWVQHDLGKGAQYGHVYPAELAQRYGKVLNLADFVRKAQLANYEAYRAMYEGRFAKMFQPTTGVIAWMSHSAHPSFVWQIYSWDLEPNSSLFAAKKACEPVHIMLNESNGNLQAINNLGTPLPNVLLTVAIFGLDGSKVWQQEMTGSLAATAITDFGLVELPPDLPNLHFVKLWLTDTTSSNQISENFYWRGTFGNEEDLSALETMPTVQLETAVKRHDADGKCFLNVTLRNPLGGIALMAHLQVRRRFSGARVLPVFYSDNYISLLPQESMEVSIEVDLAHLAGEKPLVVIDGWNVDTVPTYSDACDVEANTQARVSSWPVTGLPILGENLL